jgi:hypothetical protein
MKEYTFRFRGKSYQLTDKWEEDSVNNSKGFQLKQFKYLEEIHDYDTIKNRISNQIKFGYLKEL